MITHTEPQAQESTNQYQVLLQAAAKEFYINKGCNDGNQTKKLQELANDKLANYFYLAPPEDLTEKNKFQQEMVTQLSPYLDSLKTDKSKKNILIRNGSQWGPLFELSGSTNSSLSATIKKGLKNLNLPDYSIIIVGCTAVKVSEKILKSSESSNLKKKHHDTTSQSVERSVGHQNLVNLYKAVLASEENPDRSANSQNMGDQNLCVQRQKNTQNSRQESSAQKRKFEDISYSSSDEDQIHESWKVINKLYEEKDTFEQEIIELSEFNSTLQKQIEDSLTESQQILLGIFKPLKESLENINNALAKQSSDYLAKRKEMANKSSKLGEDSHLENRVEVDSNKINQKWEEITVQRGWVLSKEILDLFLNPSTKEQALANKDLFQTLVQYQELSNQYHELLENCKKNFIEYKKQKQQSLFFIEKIQNAKNNELKEKRDSQAEKARGLEETAKKSQTDLEHLKRIRYQFLNNRRPPLTQESSQQIPTNHRPSNNSNLD